MGVALVVLGSFQNTNAVYNNTVANTTVIAVMSSYSTLVGWLPIIVVIVACLKVSSSRLKLPLYLGCSDSVLVADRAEESPSDNYIIDKAIT